MCLELGMVLGSCVGGSIVVGRGSWGIYSWGEGLVKELIAGE